MLHFPLRNTAPLATLPDILIQDPVRQVAYLLPANGMDAFRATPGTWEAIGSNTVTFVIPSEDMVDELPPFVHNPADMPDVLIQDPTANAAYFLTVQQLQQFQVEQPIVHGGYGISFSIPSGMDIIEELPSLMRSLLQSGS